MHVKLVAIVFTIARLAPPAKAHPIESTSAGYADFECVSETSFWLGGAEMQCGPGTYCKDVGELDGSPCVSDSSGGACPLDVDQHGVEPAATGESPPVATGTANGDTPESVDHTAASSTGSDTAIVEPSESPQGTDLKVTTTGAVPGETALTDAANTSATENATATVAAAYMDYGRPRPDGHGPPAAVTTQQLVSKTADPAPVAPDTMVAPAPAPASSILPALDANAANPAIPTAVVADPAPAATTQPLPTTAAGVAPATNANASGDYEAGSITFNPTGPDAVSACGPKFGSRHVALAPALFGGIPTNGNTGVHCGKTITITYKGHSVTGVPVLDKCMGCTGNDLDVSPAVFDEVFQPSLGANAQTYGRIPGDHPDLGHVTWRFE